MKKKDKSQKTKFEILLKGITKKVKNKAIELDNLKAKLKKIEDHIKANPRDFQGVLAKRKARDNLLRNNLFFLLLQRRQETGKIKMQMAINNKRTQRSQKN